MKSVTAKGKGEWVFGTLENGLIALHRKHIFPSPQKTIDTMGNYWVFGVAQIEDGNVSYRTKYPSVELKKSYGIFLPKWCLVYGEILCKAQNIRCLISDRSLPDGAPTYACVFDLLKGKALPENSAEALSYLSKCKNRLSIEFNENPTGFGRKIKHIIDDSYKSDKNLRLLAQNLKTNQTTFGRAFREDFGISPVKYRNNLRIVAASFEMLKGRKSTDVFQDIGFNDLSRFNKQFKSLTGTSPKKFSPKKKNRKTPGF